MYFFLFLKKKKKEKERKNISCVVINNNNSIFCQTVLVFKSLLKICTGESYSSTKKMVNQYNEPNPTVLMLDSLCIMYYSRLSLSRISRDSLKYFEISVPRYIRFAELRKN